jgi:hypothetical protein
MGMNTLNEEMVRLNLFSGQAKKPWASCDVPRSWIDRLKAIAKKQHKSVADVYTQAFRQYLRNRKAARS